jgi:hypothetical protein
MPETRASAPPPQNPGSSAKIPADPLAPMKLLGAWLFVGLPAAWGVWQVVVKSMALFK